MLAAVSGSVQPRSDPAWIAKTAPTTATTDRTAPPVSNGSPVRSRGVRHDPGGKRGRRHHEHDGKREQPPPARDVDEQRGDEHPEQPARARDAGRDADGLKHGQRLGDVLLADALSRVIEASESGPAVRAIVVGAATDRGRALYARFGFVLAPGRDHRMVVRAETIVKALRQR